MQNAECRMLKAGLIAARTERARSTLRVPRFTLHAPHPLRPSRAFSLIEILVTVALLSFIILGLFAMFNQTQRAFVTGMGQTDILESSRAVTDMLGRELEQAVPSSANAVNFCARIPNPSPLLQKLPGTTLMRTNYLEDVFVLTRQNQTWTGIGYCVRTNDVKGQLWPAEVGNGAGVGSLYRFSMSVPATYFNTNRLTDPLNGLPQNPNVLYAAFLSACLPGSAAISNRICDGVVHFYVRAFATNGYPVYCDGARTNAWFLIRTNGPNFAYGLMRQASAAPNSYCPDGYVQLYSWSNAVPAALEMELGVLEPRALARFNSIAQANAQRDYFQRDEMSTRVHLFRQRIPIRNVDPAAYQ